MTAKCIFDNCSKKASYGKINETAKYCNTHKISNMINLKIKRCEIKDCNISANFGLPNQHVSYCKKHKADNMILINKKQCEYENCNKQPNFNIAGNPPRFCVDHKTNNMINVKYRKCHNIDCLKQGTFSKKNINEVFCLEHKTNDMVDIKHKYCEYTNCTLRAIYDIPNGKGRYCNKHKFPNMIDIIHKKCEYLNCNSRPIYDINIGKGRFCVKHKDSNMVNVVNKTCEYENCKITSPVFDFQNGRGRFCVKHRQPNMINVKLKRCIECATGVLYGLPGMTPSHCAKHRKTGMIRRSNGKCIMKDCDLYALYGINYTPIHCELHKSINEQNLIERECVSCNLIMLLDKNNTCEYCNPNSFKNIKLYKQNSLMEYLDMRTDLPIPTSTDVLIEGGECGKERPDRVYDFGNKIIIIECDEHQHRTHNTICENIRMINITQSFGGIPVYFIRWNPDNYKTLFEIEKLENRQKNIGDYLYDIFKNNINLPNALTSVFYMYYDNWNGIHIQNWEILLRYD